MAAPSIEQVRLPSALRVLVVDDDPDTALEIETVLHRAMQGSSVQSRRVELVAEAMEQIRHAHYDVILIDIGVADLPSPEAIEQLRDAFAYSPIIALSKYPDDELALLWVRSGADDCLYTGVLNERILGRVVHYAIERANTYRTLHERSQTRHILNALLRLSLQDLPLQDLLQRGLDIIVSAPFAAILRKGGIFLADEAQQTLELVAQTNLDHEVRVGCARVPFGQCLCGKAAATRQMLHADCGAGGHGGPGSGGEPHGHYCMPIVSRDTLLGVIVLYLEAGHQAQRNELEFLDGVADTLAGIIERWTTQQHLFRVHRQNSRLLAAITSILVGVDGQDCISHWNSAAERCFGLSADQVLGQPIMQSGIDWDWAEVTKNVLACLSGGSPSDRFEVRFRPRQGHGGLLSVTVTPFADAGPGAYLLIAEDVTDQKSKDSRLMQAQKLQSIGQLAAGIAHEINTPIQYVRDNLRFLEEGFKEIQAVLEQARRIAAALQEDQSPGEAVAALADAVANSDLEFRLEETPDAISQSLEGVQRVAGIVRAMKDFSHPGTEEKSPVDLNRAILSTVTVSRNEWKYVAELETDLDPALPPVLGLAGPLNEVILNVLVNAAQAVGEALAGRSGHKGSIRITTRLVGDWVETRISDNGGGIPERARPYVFDPFFTTKEVGQGTGQGLAMCHHIVVEQHGGDIGFDTATGQGTTFIIRLPPEPADEP